MEKNKDLEFIKKFSKITIQNICSQNGISKSNIWSGKASSEKIRLVKEEIKKRLKELEKNVN